MRFHRLDWVYILGAGLIVLLIYSLPTPRERNPRVPTTPEHQNPRTTATCLGCHAEGKTQPLPASHPKRTNCFRCHQLEEPETVERIGFAPRTEEILNARAQPTGPSRLMGSLSPKAVVDGLQWSAWAGKE